MYFRGRSPGGASLARIITVIALACVVAALVAFALLRTDGATRAASGAPAPAGETSPQSPSATTRTTPTPSSAPSPAPTPNANPADERFLAVGGDALWRATAGTCTGAAPLIERSADGGRTWQNVTPSGAHLAQILSLDPLGHDGAQAVVAADPGCTVEGIRTFTAGSTWAQSTASLSGARYLDPNDASAVRVDAREFPAPCPQASGLRATGAVVTSICDDTAYVRIGDAWHALPGTGVVAVAVDGNDVVTARRGDADCSGVALARFTNGDGSGASVGCTADAAASGPVAIASSPSGVYVWAGDTVTLVSN